MVPNDSRSRFLETLEAKLVTLVKVPALTCLTKLDEPVVIPKMVRTQKSLNQGCFPITNQFVDDQYRIHQMNEFFFHEFFLSLRN